MFKPSMNGTRINKIGVSELFNTGQPVKEGCSTKRSFAP